MAVKRKPLSARVVKGKGLSYQVEADQKYL